MDKQFINKILTIPLIAIPLAVILIIKFKPNFFDLILNKSANPKVNISTAIDSLTVNDNLAPPYLVATKAENSLSTDDIKALGYTGQNKIVTDSKGNLYLAYRKKDKRDYAIYVAKYSNKLQFESKVSDIPTTQRVPSITIDNQDNLYIVWYGLDKDESTGRQIKFSTSTDGGKRWSSSKNIAFIEGYDNAEYWQEHPQIIVFNQILFVVWEGRDKEHQNQQIKFTRSMDFGQTWLEYKNLFPMTDVQSRPSLVATETDLHLFFYSTYNSKDQKIMHSVSTNQGLSWKDPNAISSDFDSRHVTAAYNQKSVIAAWRGQSSPNSKSQIFYARYENDNWTKPQTIVDNDEYQFFPSIGTNSLNDIAITWMQTANEPDFPREDPQIGESYVALYDNETNKFDRIQKIAAKTALYPSIGSKNAYSPTFHIGYEEITTDNIIINILSFSP